MFYFKTQMKVPNIAMSGLQCQGWIQDMDPGYGEGAPWPFTLKFTIIKFKDVFHIPEFHGKLNMKIIF
jgi:hypothetical protein